MRKIAGIALVGASLIYAQRGGGDWTTSTTGWIAVGVAALVCLALVLSDSRWWRMGKLRG